MAEPAEGWIAADSGASKLLSPHVFSSLDELRSAFADDPRRVVAWPLHGPSVQLYEDDDASPGEQLGREDLQLAILTALTDSRDSGPLSTRQLSRRLPTFTQVWPCDRRRHDADGTHSSIDYKSALCDGRSVTYVCWQRYPNVYTALLQLEEWGLAVRQYDRCTPLWSLHPSLAEQDPIDSYFDAKEMRRSML